MPREINFQGRVISVPDHFTDEDVAKVLAEAAKTPQTGNPQPPSAAPTKDGGYGVAGDLAASVVSGLGVAGRELLMTPWTIDRLARNATEKVVDVAESGVRKVIGLDPVTPEQKAARQAYLDRGLGKLRKFGDAAQDSVREYTDRPMTRDQFGLGLGYEPDTTVGQVVKTAASFAGPSLLTNTSRSLGEKVIGEMLLPAVGAETAASISDDPFTRFVGALIGGGAGGYVLSKSVSPDAAIKNALPRDGLTKEQWEKAAQIQKIAEDKFNYKLLGQERIDQATKSATQLGPLVRVAGNSQPGGAVLSPIYAERPTQTNNAVNAILDNLAPQAKNPSVIGPVMAENAQQAVRDANKALTAQTRPYYRAAEPQTAQVDLDTPAFQETLKDLRSRPVLGPLFADKPDNSIAVIDAVTKEMNAAARNMKTSASPTGLKPLEQSIYERAAEDIRDGARKAVPDYDTALSEQVRLRKETLLPIEAGPLGRVASADTTGTAISAFLPRKPLVGSEQEMADAAKTLAGKDPELFKQFMRQAVAQDFNDAKGVLDVAADMSAPQRVGDRFVDLAAGNEQQRKNLLAALGAADQTGGASKDFGDLLTVLDAAKRRPQMNSATQANAQIESTLKQGSLPQRTHETIMSLGTNIPGRVQDYGRQFWYGKNLETVADIMAGPDSVGRIRAIAEGATPRFNTPSELARWYASNLTPLLFRSGLQSQIPLGEQPPQ